MFGNKLKEYRTKNHETQENIAKLCGVHYATVSSWERGQAEPSYEILKKLAEHFNTSPNELLGINDYGEDKFEQLKRLLEENDLKVNDDLTIEKLDKALTIIKVLEEEQK